MRTDTGNLKAAAAAVISLLLVILGGRGIAGGLVLASTAVSLPDGAAAVLREKYVSAGSGADASSGSETSPEEPEGTNPDGGLPDEASELSSPEPESACEDIPEEYCGVITEVNMQGDSTANFVNYKNCRIRNYTDMTGDEILSVLAEPFTISLPATGCEVIIYHTHATEAFEEADTGYFDTRNTWRDTNNENNITAAGRVLKDGIEAAGLSVVADGTQHDNPSYGGAYERSAVTVAGLMEGLDGTPVLLDVHRDAIQKATGSLTKAVAVIDGVKAAQIMIIAPCDISGALGIPEWRENLRFAAGLTDALETACPGLMRPVFFCERAYNYKLSPGALLLEFGTSGNTLEEVLYSARLAAPVIAEYIKASAG